MFSACTIKLMAKGGDCDGGRTKCMPVFLQGRHLLQDPVKISGLGNEAEIIVPCSLYLSTDIHAHRRSVLVQRDI